MSQRVPPLDRKRLERTLVAVLDLALPACSRFDWRLVGTAAALLHGVPLPTADVDILVRERAAVDAFSAALSSYPCAAAPAWLEHSRQYYCAYDVNGARMEFSTVEVPSDLEYIETFGLGPWVRCALLPCGPYSVPTVALELRLITELRRQRPDRYRPILEFMAVHGCDLRFIRSAIAAAGVPHALQEEVMSGLGGQSLVAA
ncbi:MAG: hypothetical protein HPY83_17680 [Anaerolineae bacterium]|nr:hypothetical protein [Anaerolineae bacterium]